MYKIDMNGDNRLDMEFSGKMDSDEMKAALDEMVSKAENIRKGKMLYRLSEFDFPTLSAIGVELSRLPELFKTIRKFDRSAVISDKKWVQKISEILTGRKERILVIQKRQPQGCGCRAYRDVFTATFE